MPFALKNKFFSHCGENQNDRNIDVFYFYVDYLETDKLPEGMGAFSCLVQSRTDQCSAGMGKQWGTWDHKETILPVLIIMCSLKQKAKDILWRSITMYLPLSPFGMEGEGDDMWLINGEKIPSLIGTGKEDF